MDRWPVAVGVLPGANGAWAGIQRDPDGFRLVFGDPRGTRRWLSPAAASDRRQELLAIAVAYYQDSLLPAAVELEATQADLGDLLRWLASEEADPNRRRGLEEAVDAIDDGLAADVVVRRLSLAGGGSGTMEQADVVDLLVRRYRALCERAREEEAP